MKTTRILSIATTLAMGMTAGLHAGMTEHQPPAPLPEFKTPEQLAKWRSETTARTSAQEASRTTPPDSSTPFYTGKPYLAESGSYAFKYREYNPEMGRWTTVDPSGFPDGPNNRVYVAAPTSEIDNNGLDVINLLDPNGADKLASIGIGPFGHSAALIGTDGKYTYLSYGNSDKNNGDSYTTLTQALKAIAGLGYTEGELFRCDKSSDASAISAFNSFFDGSYDPTSHNCLGAVQAALDGAGIQYVTSDPSCAPKKFFIMNITDHHYNPVNGFTLYE